MDHDWLINVAAACSADFAVFFVREFEPSLVWYRNHFFIDKA